MADFEIETGWTDERLMRITDLIHEVFNDQPDDSPAETALREAMRLTELADRYIEERRREETTHGR